MTDVVPIETAADLCEGCRLPHLDGCDFGRMEPEPGQAPRRCPNFTRRKHCDSLAARWPVPRRYVEANLADFSNPNGDGQCEAMLGDIETFLARMIENPNAIHPGVVIRGPNGTGKTRLAAAIIHRAGELGLSGAFANAAGLVQRIRQTFDGQAEVSQAEIFDDICGADVFALDDLGKERRTDFANEILWTAISTRYADGKPTVITTNLSANELADSPAWGGIVDRLAESAIVVRMNGSSRRQRGPTFEVGGGQGASAD